MADKANSEQAIASLQNALSAFHCEKDADIETFLHTKALEFAARGWCHTYLLVQEEAFLQGEIKIEAYFTLSHKTMTVQQSMTGSKVKQVSGFKTAESLHFVLIGQIGKQIGYNKDGVLETSLLSMKQILTYLFEIIYAASALIPCRCMLVECNDAIEAKGVYPANGFSYFQHDGGHHQYIKVI